MADFLVDTFTAPDNTLLQNHTPEIGGTWEPLEFDTWQFSFHEGDLAIIDGRVECVTQLFSLMHRNTADPGADEYDVKFRSRQPPDLGRPTTINVRTSPVGTWEGDVDRYHIEFMGFGSSSDPAKLFRVVNGTWTELARGGPSLNDGLPHDFRIEVRVGSIGVYVDDVEVFTVEDDAITQRGRVAIGTSRGHSGDQESGWIDDLVCTAIGVEPPPVGEPALSVARADGRYSRTENAHGRYRDAESAQGHYPSSPIHARGAIPR